jgi:hypothetical protein
MDHEKQQGLNISFLVIYELRLYSANASVVQVRHKC